MKPALRLFSTQSPFPNFFKRSLDELVRLSTFAAKLESTEIPTKPFELWDFTDPNGAKACKVISDQDASGQSRAHLDFVPGSEDINSSSPAHAHFQGTISNDLPHLFSEDGDVDTNGFAAFRTLERPRTLFGRTLWDVDPYSFLALRIKSDGRKFKVNLQSETVVYTDIHQHRLYAKKPGQWETVLIKWSDFVRTNQGIVVEPQSELNREKIRTIGIGLTDRRPGPFSLCISKVWATNAQSKEEMDQMLQGAPMKPRFLPKDLD